MIKSLRALTAVQKVCGATALSLALVTIGCNCPCMGPFASLRRPTGWLPPGCAVLTTPEAWIAESGLPVQTRWEGVSIYPVRNMDEEEKFAKNVSRYDVRVDTSGILLKIRSPNEAGGESQNVFRHLRGRLVNASQAEWSSAEPLTPVRDARGRSGAPREMAQHFYRGVGVQHSKAQSFVVDGVLHVRAKSAWHSVSRWAPGLEGTTRVVELFSPFALRRTVSIDFYRLDPPQGRYGINSNLVQVPFASATYSMCGQEAFMLYASAWYGDRYYAMPLRTDGQALLFCDFPDK